MTKRGPVLADGGFPSPDLEEVERRAIKVYPRRTEARRGARIGAVSQRNLVLILARDLADKLASAMFVVDHEGTLIYFNEQAGEILGRSFGEVGRMRVREWATTFVSVDEHGDPLPVEGLPLGIALLRRSPSHQALRLRAADGTERDIAVTAIPLFARTDEFVGAAAIFWEQPGGEGTT